MDSSEKGRAKEMNADRLRGPGALRWILGAAVVLSLALSAYVPAARVGTALGQPLSPSGEGDLVLPDLITLPPSDFRLVGDSRSSNRLLRFTNTVANAGPGPMEITGTRIPTNGRYHVRQHLYARDGTRARVSVIPEIIFHPGHDHWHLDDFARYELWSVRHDGSVEDIVSIQSKVSYCMLDTDRWTVSEAANRTYFGCVPTLQGLSVGWADSYESHLDGQSLDITGLPNGLYALRSVVDPHNHLIESNDQNNEAAVLLRLIGNQVEVVTDLSLNWDRLDALLPPSLTSGDYLID